MKLLILFAAFFGVNQSQAGTPQDYLVQIKPQKTMFQIQRQVPIGAKIESLGVNNWYRVQLPENQTSSVQLMAQNPSFEKVQKNFKLGLLHDFRIKDPQARKQLEKILKDELPFPLPGDGGKGGAAKDNPEIPSGGGGGRGSDPEFSKQWGMRQIGVQDAWKQTKGSSDVVVAVIDTGVDYTHEDLVENMWRNPGEMGRDAQGRDKSKNGIDDDGNGYVDDVVGWDFVSNDNKPYDLSMSFMEIIFGGGNPGHGTHCAGNVAARSDNGKGIAGVAPNVKIMALRFLSEKGQGTTADAVKAIRYAVDNGAKVLSNSWGSEGEDKNDPSNQALKDAIQYSQDRGALFVAAAGNGHQGKGYDNDTDRAPAYPASYDHDIIVSVAAVNESGQLGSFSNWGRRTVDLGAPGVKVFSTVPGNRYEDTLGSFLGQTVTWDGTSMATPHVAGAAALYWSQHPNATWQDVKGALMKSVKKTSVLSSKSVSGGQLEVTTLLRN